MSKWPALLWMGLLLAACAAQNTPTSSVTAPLGPMTPIQAGVSAGVLLEDLTETPEEDAKSATVLEVISDCLNAPWQIAMTYTAVIGGILWTVADMPFHGYERGTFQRRAQTILDHLPHETAAPPAYYRERHEK